MSELSNHIMHEIMAYEKFNGKKPAYLILADKEIANQLFAESYRFTMSTEGIDFKNPELFMGAKILHRKIWSYGGSCKWLLAGDL